MKVMRFVAVALCSAMLLGCSEKTQQETKEMLDEAGDAASSAVEDSKENLEKAGDAIKAAGDELTGDDEPATETDAAPETEEEAP
jgi:hypothetical protein